jgi:dihydroneopterin aldolase
LDFVARCRVKTVNPIFVILAGDLRPKGQSNSSLLMDIVYIRDIKIECVIGVWDWERRVKQTVRIDLEMSADAARAARSDKIDDTLDYKAVTKRVVEFAGASEFQLVETLAEKIADIIRREFSVLWVRVRANKRGALRDAGDVGVVIERGDPKSAPRSSGDR